MEKKIELAKRLADEQMDKACTMEFYDDCDMISFLHNEVRIIDPWYDSTGRFELNDAEAVKEYGLANVMDFIERAAKKAMEA